MKIFRLTGVLHIQLIFLSIFVFHSEGRYLVQLRILSYNNPGDKCAECSHEHPLQSPFGCCDEFENLGTCSGSDRCDNYFLYCLRGIGTPLTTRGCTQGSVVQSRRPTGEQRDGDNINFSQSAVLGLPNPLLLQGITNTWEGVQVYIEVRDDDPSSNDELVDNFAIDIVGTVPLGAEETNTLQFTGRFNLGTIDISYRVICEENYYGDLCENFDECRANQISCTGNGLCIDQEQTFLCQCNPGFLGQLCEIVDYCQEIDCSGQGLCQNGADSFTCICNPGYTGQQCETDIDECIGVNCSGNGLCTDGVNSFFCNCNPGYTGQLCNDTLPGSGREASVGGAVGGVIGGVIVVILVLLIVMITIVIVYNSDHQSKSNNTQELDGYRSYGTDNPVYGMPQTANRISVIVNPSSGALPTLHTNNSTIEPNDEREFDNPLYEPSDIPGSSASQPSNSSDSEVYSFVGQNGSYYESLHEGELAI